MKVKPTEKMLEILKVLLCEPDVLEALEDVEIIGTELLEQEEPNLKMKVLRVRFTGRLTVQLPARDTREFLKEVNYHPNEGG